MSGPLAVILTHPGPPLFHGSDEAAAISALNSRHTPPLWLVFLPHFPQIPFTASQTSSKHLHACIPKVVAPRCGDRR